MNQYWVLNYLVGTCCTLTTLYFIRMWLRGTIDGLSMLVSIAILNGAIVQQTLPFSLQLMAGMSFWEAALWNFLVFVAWLPTVALVAVVFSRVADRLEVPRMKKRAR